VAGFEICILEQMASAAERISWLAPEIAAQSVFAGPNLVVLKRRPQTAASPPRALFLGMPDDQFAHQQGLISKAEVRVLALARLQLRPGDTLRDLGAGSGSLAVEAAVLIRRGLIFVVEQDPQRIQQIRQNAARFGVSNLAAVQAVLSEGLASLPDPNRIFIGGGGRHLAAIIGQAASRLKPGDRMVVNAVLLDNIQTALDAMQPLGWEAELVQVQISRSQKMPWSRRMAAHNPVWIISGANQLALEVARITAADPVITTATDLSGVPAIDLLAQENHLSIENPAAIQYVSMALLTGQPVRLHDPMGWIGHRLPAGAVIAFDTPEAKGATAGV
jgi:precorrin-6Y C5,15-methyltransferase (decarboxylating)